MVSYVRNFEKRLGFKSEIKWRTFFVITFFHVFGLYWACLHAYPVKWQTLVFGYCVGILNGIGIIAGCHRLWTHRCYKATLSLRIFLMLAFASAGQNSIYDWVRDHRVHHKFSDTEADPHNINRGFTFAHIGWLMLKKNDRVLEKGRQIDMSDILQDPVCVFEKKYSNLLSFIFCYVVPIVIGIYVIGEKWECAVAWLWFIRIMSSLHAEMSVNSFAHMFGNKPYNRKINPTENRWVSIMSIGEGWHNYHHMFPNDWKAAETFHITDGATIFIRVCEKLGLAWDLKEPTPELIQAVINNHGKVEKIEESQENVIKDQRDEENNEFQKDIAFEKSENGLRARVSSALG